MISTHEIDGWFNYSETYDMLINTIPSGGIFVECGAWLGKSSSYLADRIALNRPDISLYIVDSWLGSAAELDTSHKLAIQTDIYQIFLQNMGYRKFTSIRKLSVDAANDFDNDSLDVIFIDMSHEYEDVKQDITSWLPKLKIGGHIAGHDYSWPGVNQAVSEKFKHSNTTLKSSAGDCWIYKKERNINE